MKDFNDLLQQFDDIQELPVSEETVGAFIENKLDDISFNKFRDLMSHDESLSELTKDVSKEMPTFNAEDYFSDDVIDLDSLPVLTYEEMSESQYEQDNPNYANGLENPVTEDALETPEYIVNEDEDPFNETSDDYDTLNYNNLEY